ncbi:MAG: protein translocase subunit SecF [Ignavibacteriae bacterium HGW-Ignavibacteriae-3]|nr:MAG: protein translocase subunit SecF [Ignavibacteriae bacterium HGW-Ignavibacteriae-3]
MRLFDNLHIDFMAKRTTFYLVSSVILLLGLATIVFKGVEFGIDFKGGSEIALKFDKPVDIEKMRTEVLKLGIGNVEVKTFGDASGVLLRTELQELPKNVLMNVRGAIESEMTNVYPGLEKTITDSTATSLTYSFPDPQTAIVINNKLFAAGYQSSLESVEPTNTNVNIRLGIADLIKERLSETYTHNPFKVEKEDRVGPKVGKELKRDAVLSIILSLIVILIYLGFRFKLAFAIGAVMALFHDVLLTLGVFAALYGVIPGFNLEISVSVVAAFLTLIGFSINDTVIVFDRVREQMKIHKTLPIEENMNMAINRTMSRTIITVFTVLLTIIALLIFGGEVLRGFAFALFIGMITGTYSSIFVASAFVMEYAKRTKTKLTF